MKIVVVTGGRTYIGLGLTAALDKLAPEMVIEGGCRRVAGSTADFLAKEWARKNERPCLTWPARWNEGTQGAFEGPKRNEVMMAFAAAQGLALGHEVFVVAADGGKGTEDAIKAAVRNGLEVLRIQD